MRAFTVSLVLLALLAGAQAGESRAAEFQAVCWDQTQMSSPAAAQQHSGRGVSARGQLDGRSGTRSYRSYQRQLAPHWGTSGTQCASVQQQAAERGCASASGPISTRGDQRTQQHQLQSATAAVLVGLFVSKQQQIAE